MSVPSSEFLVNDVGILMPVIDTDPHLWRRLVSNYASV
jgi:hypothetical protein